MQECVNKCASPLSPVNFITVSSSSVPSQPKHSNTKISWINFSQFTEYKLWKNKIFLLTVAKFCWNVKEKIKQVQPTVFFFFFPPSSLALYVLSILKSVCVCIDSLEVPLIVLLHEPVSSTLVMVRSQVDSCKPPFPSCRPYLSAAFFIFFLQENHIASDEGILSFVADSVQATPSPTSLSPPALSS